ncbi:hypothetical protein GCK32_012990 [Trichostrongylus colubriformis]|uniref:TLC domain-containing protein n=1 Tax=Trichostrongylus colubriformis TaxID=6319 RepID=A0AAN8IMA0_TRICO
MDFWRADRWLPRGIEWHQVPTNFYDLAFPIYFALPLVVFRWYYMIETSFYYSLLFGSFFDVKRSDFWQMIIHHVVTIGLLSTSYTINFVRWLVSRLGYYPFVLVRSALFDASGLIQPDYEILNFSQAGILDRISKRESIIFFSHIDCYVPYAPRAIILMLFALLILHIFWTIIIMKIVIKTVTQGEAGDVRSDSELSGEEDTAKLIKGSMNHFGFLVRGNASNVKDGRAPQQDPVLVGRFPVTELFRSENGPIAGLSSNGPITGL